MKTLLEKFPFEKYGDGLIKIALYQYGIRVNSYEYSECFDAGMMAYFYSISRCAVINCIHVRAYLNKVIRIYIKCALVICSEAHNICKENNFKLIEIDNIDNINKF